MSIIWLLLPLSFLKAENFVFNPLDLDFDRLVPDEFASLTIKKRREFNPDQSTLPACVCDKKIGVPFVFWEPIMLAEVIRKPFSSLVSPIKLKSIASIGFNGGETARNHGFLYVHLYDFPVLSIVKSALPDIYWKYLPEGVEKCLSPNKKFKVRYLSELDITQNISPFALLYTPEIAALTQKGALMKTHIACTVDYNAARLRQPIDSLYFCSGARNFLFPLSGHLANNSSPLEDALLVLERMIFKQHRLSFFSGEKMGTCGKSAACSYQKSFTPRKSQYAFQLLYPKPKKTLTIDWGAPVPLKELGFSQLNTDFVFLVWRKRYCCL